MPPLKWAEALDQPGVQRSDQYVFPPDHVSGVVDLVGQGVFLREAAAVVGDAVAEQDPCFQAACTSEGAGLTYVRREDGHGYVLRRGDVNVAVTGDVSVNRSLLRDAALAARPASQDELLRALPLPPDRDLLDRLRAWLQTRT